MLPPYELETDAGPPVVEIAVDCGSLGVIRVWTAALRARGRPATRGGATQLAYDLLADDELEATHERR